VDCGLHKCRGWCESEEGEGLLYCYQPSLPPSLPPFLALLLFCFRRRKEGGREGGEEGEGRGGPLDEGAGGAKDGEEGGVKSEDVREELRVVCG